MLLLLFGGSKKAALRSNVASSNSHFDEAICQIRGLAQPSARTTMKWVPHPCASFAQGWAAD